MARHPVADDIGAGTSTAWQWRKQLEMEGLIAQKDDMNDARTPEQIFTLLLESAALSEHELTSLPERLRTVRLIDEAVNCGARQHRACEVAGITARTLQRWRQDGEVLKGENGRETRLRYHSNRIRMPVSL